MSVNAPQPSAPAGSVTPEANLYQYLELTATLAQAQTALASECALALSFNGLNHAVMMVSPGAARSATLAARFTPCPYTSFSSAYRLVALSPARRYRRWLAGKVSLSGGADPRREGEALGD